ncbi:MAG: HEAT repeat domain-containing protein [Promethearchaeota archaeon]
MGKEYYRPAGENPYKVRNTPSKVQNQTPPKDTPINFKTERVCPACGKIIKISHNFCKFCGIDLSTIIPLGDSDRTVIELAKTALTDQDADVRRDAVNTIGDLGERDVLGILTYILINDIDALVRKEAANELGNKHNTISIDILTKALKDRSPIVRKQAIEALKRIKKLAHPEQKHDKIVEQQVPLEREVESEQKADSNHEVSEEEDKIEDPLREIDPHDDDFYNV